MRWPTSLPRLDSALALVLVFVVALPAVTRRLNASDEIEFFAWLRSAVFDRDADFENEYQHFYDTGAARNAGFHETFLERVNENGRRHNFAPIGSAILWTPFYAVGHLAASVTGQPTDGFSPPYVSAVAYGSAVYGLLALLLAHSLVRQVVGRGLAATWVVWFGTPLVFYMYVAPGFSHACSAFAVALFLWTWMRVRERWAASGAVVLGLSGALMAMVREQDVLFVIGPAVDFVAWTWRTHRNRGSGGTPPDPRLAAVALTGLAGAIVFLLAYSPQLAAYTALNGHPSPTTVVTSKMTWTAPHFFGVLFSPEHGLFFWTPLAVGAIAGLLRLAVTGAGAAAPEARWLGGLALLMVLVQAYVSGSVESWTVAGSFGQRRFVALTPLLALGLAALWPTAATPAAARRLAVAAAGLAVWWNLGLMAQFGLHLMDRQRLTPLANARTTFVDLPARAPAIAWRYLTDRESFYGLPPQEGP